MKVRTLWSGLAVIVAATVGLALVLAFVLAGGPQRLADSPVRAQGQIQCGTGGYDLQLYQGDVVTLTPDSGLPSSSFDVGLSSIAPNDYDDQPVEALWDWDLKAGYGELIGNGTVPESATEVTFGATVPDDAQPSEHTVTVCWLDVQQIWYYRNAKFTVPATVPSDGSPTPTPKATATPPPAEFICTKPPDTRTFELQLGWNNFVWTGASGVDPATTLSCMEGSYAVAYRFDPSSQKFERHVPGRCDEQPGLCNMTRLNRFDVLLVKAVFKLRNPALNSVITAHGNTDWHIDTAEEFLFGTDMGGSPSAANHTPDTWTRRHMHVGLTNTANFYCDSDLTSSGADTDATSGIDDGSMLFFYAGHGCPTYWNTLGNNASQGNMSLADSADGGRLRYYWQCSCEVFAHGPRDCTGATMHYACPGDFDGSADSYNMRNVYERWGPVLEPDLRMACGASTSAWCWHTQTNAIWNNYNNLGRDVADSFIDGLATGNVVPLCITMGGWNVTTTPLYDTTFTNQPNTSGTSHYHIQYLSNFASIWRGPLILPLEINLRVIPKVLPIFELQPMRLPAPISDLEFQCEGDFMTHDGGRGEPWTQVRVNRLSGAVNVFGERKVTLDGPVLKEEEYTQRALSFIGDQGWDGGDFAAPMGARFMIETVPVEGGADGQGITITRGDIRLSQKNVLLTFKRQVNVGGVLVNVLGEGGEISVQMNNDGSVMNASNVSREISGVKEEAAPVKTYDEAYEEALEQLENPQAYELESWTWGYLEAAGNVEQTELRIVFRFWFVATDPEASVEYPPQMIEILGQAQ